MVTIYKSKAKVQKGPQHLDLTIERWDMDAQSIAFSDGKICFVEGALPGETVKVKITEQKPQYLKAQVQKVLKASEHRIAPLCRFAGECGGCQLHHVSAEQSRVFKQQAIDQQLKHQLKLDCLPWQPLLHGDATGYRRKARIGVWFEKKTNAFVVGFRRKGGKEITAVSNCMVLSPVIAPVLEVLSSTLPKLQAGMHITHVEVLDAAGKAFVVVRHIKALPVADKNLLQQAWPEACWVGEAEPDEFQFWGEPQQAQYQLNQGLTLNFAPTDFIQVNAEVNQQMVTQALEWLNVQATDKVLDLYCGIGNFSLALAKQAAQVVGLEGVAAMVTTASNNASLNQLGNVVFAQADLHLAWPKAAWNSAAVSKSDAGPGQGRCPWRH